jgi:hypothetical protein
MEKRFRLLLHLALYFRRLEALTVLWPGLAKKSDKSKEEIQKYFEKVSIP